MCGRGGVGKPTQALRMAIFQGTQLTTHKNGNAHCILCASQSNIKESYGVQKQSDPFTGTEEGHPVEAAGSI